MDVAPERHQFSEARRKLEREGCLFFWLLFVGQATKSDSPTGENDLIKLKDKNNELISSGRGQRRST